MFTIVDYEQKNSILFTEFSKTTTKTTCDMVKGGREVI